ncbi:histidine phosphatase superfamily-domain-containing protein [Jimgerdemannia flammicorona]|uniref:Inositol hexakisphosphate and diphosphoinositol-pentakisphosphate kinase n=1 Tax=Jimgerdemannia flammicorona TaxID=994334 RepID=A0A433CY92_9FUNG|nr:histidine phosphatase superfamily-domain-containing protein [Jimgerdemannia flammicorona]
MILVDGNQVANKSSEFDPNLTEPRRDGSFIYEEFMEVDDAEDVKVYTIGPNFTHAETRKSPVVDGHVRRNTDGKEVRYITELTPVEKEMARKVCLAFGQTICGFDLLRVAGTSYVIDVNGWSFVKGNDHYYDNAARILREMFLTAGHQRKFSVSGSLPPELQFENSWRLKAFVSVFRHADRTPKQKMKFSFSSDPFVELLEGAHEEVIMRQEHQLRLVSAATAKAIAMGSEDATKLMQLKEVLDRKSELPGTKVQLKPSFDKPDGQFQKLQLIVKWGGEFTHAARYQSRDLGENLRKDMIIMNKNVLDDIKIYTSSERRVIATADIFAHSFMGTQELPPNCLITSKELLDDSNAAKEQMDAVKLRLRQLLRSDQRGSLDGAPWHEDLGEPSEMVCEVIALMHRTRETMRQNLSRAEDIDALQARWCCSESPMLFRERWEKLFKDFCDVDRDEFDPSKVSELYDSIKYDALHNRAFVEGVFADPAVPQGAEGSLDCVKELYRKARSMFDFVAPQEYGISPEEKMEIGLLTSLPLLKKIVGDLEGARTAENPCTRLYFTKGALWVPITFELYERNRTIGGDKEYSLRVGFSPGAHDPNIIDLQMDAKHCLSVAPRRNLTDHLPLDQALSYYQRHLNDPGVENIERQIIEKRYHYAEEDEDDEVAERVVMQLGEIAGEDVMMEIESEGRNEILILTKWGEWVRGGGEAEMGDDGMMDVVCLSLFSDPYVTYYLLPPLFVSLFCKYVFLFRLPIRGWSHAINFPDK